MKGKEYNVGVLFLLGAISGIVSFYLSQATYWGVLAIPGLVFGAVVGLYFFKRLGLQYVWFVIASTLSYCWGVFAVLIITYGWGIVTNPTGTLIYNTYINSPLALYTGGLLGTLFLLFAVRQFIGTPSRDASLFLLLMGSTLSLSFFVGYYIDYIFPQPNLSLPINQLFALFVIWQAGMASTFGWAVSASTGKKKLFIPIVIMLFVMVFALLISNALLDTKTKMKNIIPVVTPR